MIDPNLPVIEVDERGRFKVPEKFKDVKRLVVKQRNSTEMYIGRSVQFWGKCNEKLPENCVEFNGERYKLKRQGEMVKA